MSIVRKADAPQAGEGVATRTKGQFAYAAGRPALLCLDADASGYPPEIRDAIEAKHRGDVWAFACDIVPELRNVAHLVVPSSSARVSIPEGLKRRAPRTPTSTSSRETAQTSPGSSRACSS